jgi:hypothetical protein
MYYEGVFDEGIPMRLVMFVLALIMFALLSLFGCTLTPVNEPTPIPPPRSPQPGFQVQQAPTPVPTIPRDTFSTPVFITLTPISTSEPVDIDLPDPQPGEQTENIVEALINRVLIPAWNFLYTFLTGAVVSLWDFAGLRGGLTAQIVFCLIPGIIVTMGILWRVFRRAR